MNNEMQSIWKERCSGLTLYKQNTCLKKCRKITKKSDKKMLSVGRQMEPCT